LFAWPTTIHHHSVDGGLVDASACVFLSSGRSCLPELGHAFKIGRYYIHRVIEMQERLKEEEKHRRRKGEETSS